MEKLKNRKILEKKIVNILTKKLKKKTKENFYKRKRKIVFIFCIFAFHLAVSWSNS
jgi:hypothetical protein